MARTVSNVTLPLKSADGRTFAFLKIATSSRTEQSDGILLLEELEARAWQEIPVQLLEGRIYDYELRRPFPNARLSSEVAFSSRFSDDSVERGRLELGSDLGVLVLVLVDATGRTVASTAVEVRASKVGYRTEYRRMLSDIAARTLEILLDLRGSSAVRLRPSGERDVPSLVQQFFFVKDLVANAEFRGAITRITSMPHEASREAWADRAISSNSKATKNLAAQIASRQPRRPVPKSHPLSARVGSVPFVISVPRAAVHVDTPENRFVKLVLQTFLEFAGKVADRTAFEGGAQFGRIRQECAEIGEELQTFLAHSLFTDVSSGVFSVPAASPVLQRRPGYREVLRAWVMFQLSGDVCWDGAEDIYLAGKRDADTLYEYWVFFQLLDILSERSIFTDDAMIRLFRQSGDGLSLRLRAGRDLTLRGLWKRSKGELSVRLSYNRTFSRMANPPGDKERSFPNPGSWTRSMRPDYTVSLWSAAIDEAAAELSGEIVHLHFDAKYKLATITEVFGGEDQPDDLAGDRSVSAKTRVQREDLAKMHAYRDAIRRSASAFVLYPGSEHVRWRAYTELLPGLGAIALVPGQPDGKMVLGAFLDEAADVIAGRCLAEVP